MGFVYRFVTVGVTSSALLFVGPVTAAETNSPSADSRLSGPAADVSVAIPAGWHQVTDQADPQLLQILYPENCTEQLRCASAMARLLNTQAANAQAGAQAVEQAVATQSGVQGAAVTSEGPLQVAGRNGYQVRFSFSTATAKFQAVAAAVETGTASAGTVPTSLIFVTVSDLAGAPPATVIDQIVGSAQLKAQ